MQIYFGWSVSLFRLGPGIFIPLLLGQKMPFHGFILVVMPFREAVQPTSFYRCCGSPPLFSLRCSLSPAAVSSGATTRVPLHLSCGGPGSLSESGSHLLRGKTLSAEPSKRNPEAFQFLYLMNDPPVR